MPPVLGDAAELRRAPTSLVFDAVDAMPSGGRLLLRVRPDDGGRVEVVDGGVGIRASCGRGGRAVLLDEGEHGSGASRADVLRPFRLVRVGWERTAESRPAVDDDRSST